MLIILIIHHPDHLMHCFTEIIQIISYIVSLRSLYHWVNLEFLELTYHSYHLNHCIIQSFSSLNHSYHCIIWITVSFKSFGSLDHSDHCIIGSLCTFGIFLIYYQFIFTYHSHHYIIWIIVYNLNFLNILLIHFCL